MCLGVQEIRSVLKADHREFAHKWVARVAESHLLCQPGFVLVLIAALVLVFQTRLMAQGIEEWTNPIAISSASEQSAQPTLAVDTAGTVHVFWSGRRIDHKSEPRAILYAHYVSGQWTEPVDLMTSPNRSDAQFPRTLVDRAGRLHLFWSGQETGPFGPLYHSWAPVDEAGSLRAWQSPVKLADGTYQSDVALDPQGRLHLVYASVLDERGICHLLSEDDGDSWQESTCIPRVYPIRDQEHEVQPRIAVDTLGYLHVVWTLDDYSQQAGSGYPASAVHYARSTDSGQSWVDFAVMDEVDRRDSEYEGRPPAWVNVAVDGEDRVHIVWVRSIDMLRTHQWSEDHGIGWSSPQVVIPSGGYNNWQGLSVDGSGVLHLIWPSLNGVEYTRLQADSWSSPTIISDRGDPHHVQSAVALGNELHIVWQEYGSVAEDSPMFILHAMKQTDAPAAEPQSVPTAGARVLPPLTILPTVTAEQQATDPLPSVSSPVKAPETRASSVSPVVVGAVSSVVVIGLVILVRIRKN